MFEKHFENPIENAVNWKPCAVFAISEMTKIGKNLDFQLFFWRSEIGNPKILSFKW